LCLLSSHITSAALRVPKNREMAVSRASKRAVLAAVGEDEEEEDPFWILTQENGLDFALDYGKTYSAGRTEENDLCMPFDTVSGSHASVRISPEGEMFVTDNNSTNGSQVSKLVFGRQVLNSIEPGVETRVESGSTVVFGDDVLASFKAFSLNLSPEEDEPEVYTETEESQQVELRGPSFEKSSLTVRASVMGDGNFGEVFPGRGRGIEKGGLFGGQKETDVVLKRAKQRVVGAEDMLALEVEMNCRVAQRVKNVCADYLGYCVVPDGAGGQLYNNQLTEGLWLVFSLESRNTLESYMNLSSYPQGLLQALGKSTAGGALAATQEVMTILLQGLEKFHKEKLVHRDIKPSNILVLEESKKTKGGLRLIDLGACADLNDGFNFVLGNCPRDPTYCPPECDLMPADLADGNRVEPAKLPEYWNTYQPSSFDIYSAGVVMMQLAVPRLRSEDGLKKFNSEILECEYSLMAWKTQANLSAGETVVLDANNGAGWDLVSSIIQKPSWTYKEESGRKVAGSNDLRPSASEALNHPFFKA